MRFWLIQTNGLDHFVEALIRAATEERARELAGEGDSRFLDPDKSTCEEVTIEGDEGTVMWYDHDES
jgi:hypothetical protein